MATSEVIQSTYTSSDGKSLTLAYDPSGNILVQASIQIDGNFFQWSSIEDFRDFVNNMVAMADASNSPSQGYNELLISPFISALTFNETFTFVPQGGTGIGYIFSMLTGSYAAVTDTVDTPHIRFTANTIGEVGNYISLVFDGISTVDAIVNAWNTANPTNTVSYNGMGSVVPLANTWTLAGGVGGNITSDGIFSAPSNAETDLIQLVDSVGNIAYGVVNISATGMKYIPAYSGNPDTDSVTD